MEFSWLHLSWALFLGGLSALHESEHVHSRGYVSRAGKLRDGEDAYPSAVHPIVRTHPENDRKGLFINPIRIEGIAGMVEAEALTLLDDLLVHAVQEKYQYRN